MYVKGTAIRIWCSLFQILTKSLLGVHYHYSHFIDEETEVQRLRNFLKVIQIGDTKS